MATDKTPGTTEKRARILQPGPRDPYAAQYAHGDQVGILYPNLRDLGREAFGELSFRLVPLLEAVSTIVLGHPGLYALVFVQLGEMSDLPETSPNVTSLYLAGKSTISVYHSLYTGPENVDVDWIRAHFGPVNDALAALVLPATVDQVSVVLWRPRPGMTGMVQ